MKQIVLLVAILCMACVVGCKDTPKEKARTERPVVSDTTTRLSKAPSPSLRQIPKKTVSSTIPTNKEKDFSKEVSDLLNELNNDDDNCR